MDAQDTHDHDALPVADIVVMGTGHYQFLACRVCGDPLPHGICWGCGATLNDTNMTESRRGLVTGCRKCKTWDGKLMELPQPLQEYRDHLQENVRALQRAARAQMKKHAAQTGSHPLPPPPVRRRRGSSLLLSAAVLVAATLGILVTLRLSRAHDAGVEIVAQPK
jgi:hypothetical protein